MSNPQDAPRWRYRYPGSGTAPRHRHTAITAILVAVVSVLVALSTALPAQAGPGCDYPYYCSQAVNRSNVGIGILVNARSAYAYDWVLYPNQYTQTRVADFDKFYVGSSWCVQAHQINGAAEVTVVGPALSPNLNDWQSPWVLYAWICNGSGSW